LAALRQSRSPDADVVVALGGDGLMLQTLHSAPAFGQADHGISRHRQFSDEKSSARTISCAACRTLDRDPSMLMRAADVRGKVHLHHAINEVALFRQTHQVRGCGFDRRTRTHVGLIATASWWRRRRDPPPIIFPRRDRSCRSTPRCWPDPLRISPAPLARRLLPNTAFVVIEVLESDKRPVAAVADHDEARDVCRVEVLRQDHLDADAV
jgi:NAD+ kinase